MLKIINQIVAKTNLLPHEAWWLLEFITGKNRAELQFLDVQLTPQEEEKLATYIQQISIDHKPLAYILGWVPFLDLTLNVTPPTLIPRPETEFWVEQLIAMIKKSGIENLTILDIGTGSGCIALSLAQAFPKSQIYAVDIAETAIALAQKNAKQNNISNVIFLQSNLFNELPAHLQFDIIVSNPPYIDPAAHLQASVLDWEDHGALFAMNHGLSIIEQIMMQAKSHLTKNNTLDYQLIMEIDVSQGDIIKQLGKDCGFNHVEIQKDQFNRDRTAWIK
ncbi:MAG: peptide chain release factor N(5)-glutamine methyltransferase [Candidatus Dependentiae bacterium]|nr:peptide chain release factor N(5)-glutamine methyltransferase [Candidatus Dependentiae bacterium]